MSIEYNTAKKKIIYLQKVGNISIFLLDNKLIKLLNVAFI